ncbi:ribonucleoside-triphosphate reductase activating protein [Peptostreptococcus russellii]|uniref:Anaerobic ribonucleoside-triphosphate reductase-activating protein n=1 Tax=Peptostreptococcus russellii TaxID=215200 RepID=A0A2P7Q1L9_9FIRM|nr:anaerobic ribonucleoside-triphosphate reductase activating protein [Peptostreptococcus russellii]PSJ31859.1 ribonucleoside-triphosphate reductase activating protein [Peptostreptococcus russellii]
MRYNKIRRYDVTNGPGVRTTIFVSGCTHNCEDCFNKELQDFEYGDIWSQKSEDEFIDYVSNPMVVGINVLGGEPLQQTMDDSLLDLLKRVKNEFPEKSIWLWTGDLFEEAIENEKKLAIIEQVDVIIDGQFQKDKRNIKLKYRGSENQRVIDVRESLEKDEVVEYQFEE